MKSTCSVLALLFASSCLGASDNEPWRPLRTEKSLSEVELDFLNHFLVDDRVSLGGGIDEGDSGRAQFGRDLFFSTDMSFGRDLSCSSCHNPETHWQDGENAPPQSKGGAGSEHPTESRFYSMPRNTPSLVNVAEQRWFGWGGSSDSLWMACVRALEDPTEMAMDARSVVGRVRESATLLGSFESAWGSIDGQEDEKVLVQLGQSIAAFLSSVRARKTPFRKWAQRAVCDLGTTSVDGFSEDAERGFSLFVGKAGCSACHFGPLLTDLEFHDTRAPLLYPDRGRTRGVRRLLESPYNQEGDYGEPARPYSLFNLVPEGHEARFRTPSLIGVPNTAPYMHNGSVAELEGMVDHYNELPPPRVFGHGGEMILKPLNLDEGERASLVCFLESLSVNSPNVDFEASK